VGKLHFGLNTTFIQKVLGPCSNWLGEWNFYRLGKKTSGKGQAMAAYSMAGARFRSTNFQFVFYPIELKKILALPITRTKSLRTYLFPAQLWMESTRVYEKYKITSKKDERTS